MIELLSQPLRDVTLQDISELLREKYAEDTSLEYKGWLPHEQGRHPRYSDPSTPVSNYTRDSLLEEIVAFASAEGGTLLIGVDETDDDPPQPKSLVPIPQPHDFADRLRKQAREKIDPTIPQLIARGITLEENAIEDKFLDRAMENQAGLVIVQVPKSRKAPHRLDSTGECHVRRQDRSEPMTMREIQDLVRNRDRGQEERNRRFEDRRENFRSEVVRTNNQSEAPDPATSVRHTLLPTSNNLYIEDLREVEWYLPSDDAVARIEGQKTEIAAPGSPRQVPQPIMGGVRYERSGLIKHQLTVTRDGLVEYVLIETGDRATSDRLYSEWFVGPLFSALMAAEKFRRLAGGPTVEYGLESEILRHPEASFQVVRLGSGGPTLQKANIQEHQIPVEFPRMSVGKRSEFNRILQARYRDLCNAAGVDPSVECEMNFQEAESWLAEE